MSKTEPAPPYAPTEPLQPQHPPIPPPPPPPAFSLYPTLPPPSGYAYSYGYGPRQNLGLTTFSDYPRNRSYFDSVTVFSPLGRDSVSLTCPHCQQPIRTDVKKSPSIMAYFSSFFICFIGFFCGCCLIPFFIEDCKVSEHKCPKCNRILGKYSTYF
ncbi:UNVERIFIED_CONTAM: hypothetical protein RMT77_007400 [Armadillidium vulgare]